MRPTMQTIEFSWPLTWLAEFTGVAPSGALSILRAQRRLRDGAHVIEIGIEEMTAITRQAKEGRYFKREMELESSPQATPFTKIAT